MAVYRGVGTTAVLDGRSLTLLFDGEAVPETKRRHSPRVIPLGAITSVEYEPKSATSPGWVRVFLIGRYGYDDDPAADLNTWFLGWRGADEFVDELRTAMLGAPKLGDAPVELRQATLLGTAKGRRIGRLLVDAKGVHWDDEVHPWAGVIAVVESGAAAEALVNSLRTTVGVTVVGDLERAVAGEAMRTDRAYLFVYLQKRKVLTIAEDFALADRLRDVSFLINQAASNWNSAVRT